MRIESVPEQGILVTVDREDQKSYGVDYASMSFSDPQTRRFCESLSLLIACRKEELPDGALTIRALPGEDGTLLLYFSSPKPDAEEKTLCSRVMEFASVDALLDCRSVFRDTLACVEVYEMQGTYYLWYEAYLTPGCLQALSAELAEYGSRSRVDRSFLSEHATLLPDASAYFF